MPQGLQIRDANGNMILDITDRLTRVLGSFSTGTTDGSHTDAALSSGTPWLHATSSNPFNVYVCKYTITGNTISWAFSNLGYIAAGSRQAEYVIYGVY